MFIDNLANQFLKTIFEGDKTGNASVFIGNNCHVEMLFLHFAHQFCNWL